MSVVMNSGDVSRALRRISHEILEKNPDSSTLTLLGIPTRGAYLAQRISAHMAEIEGRAMSQGTLDVTMYRDDLRMKAPRTLLPTQIPADGIDGRDVVLVDDVFYSGRTIRAALDALAEYGRPRTVQLAVLVDRGHRELPIRADFVGKNIPTRRDERVFVTLSEIDGDDEVRIDPAQ